MRKPCPKRTCHAGANVAVHQNRQQGVRLANIDIDCFADTLTDYMHTMCTSSGSSFERVAPLSLPLEHVFLCMILSGCDFVEGFFRLTGQTIFDTYLAHFSSIGPLVSLVADDASSASSTARSDRVRLCFHERAFGELLRISWALKLKRNVRTPWGELRTSSKEKYPDEPRQHAPSVKELRAKLRRCGWTILYWENGVLGPAGVPDELERCECCDWSLHGYQDAADPGARRDVYFTDIVCKKFGVLEHIAPVAGSPASTPAVAGKGSTTHRASIKVT